MKSYSHMLVYMYLYFQSVDKYKCNLLDYFNFVKGYFKEVV